ncbi:MAG: IGHMBP2 family helicase [Candidatus Bipolaricaulota bacterium]
MHYLLVRDLNHDAGVGDIIGALSNQTRLDPESIGNIELDETFAEIEIYEERKYYDPDEIDSIGPGEVQAVQWNEEDWEHLSSYVDKYKELVQLEREEEMERHEREIRTTSGRERENMGRALLHLRGKDAGEDLGGKKMIKFSRNRKGEELPETEITVGDLVMFSKNDPLRDDNPTGTVAEKTNYSVTVAFEPPTDDFLQSRGLRADLYVNDITYQRMLKGLEKLPFHRQEDLVKKLIGLSGVDDVEAADFHPRDEKLDSSQTLAVRRGVNADPFFCIHGPPGTGKTTTLAALTEELVDRGEKVLATAASNTAVDNMVEFLIGKDLDVVRVGHPARITPFLREVSLDYRVQGHQKYEKSKELKEKAKNLQEKQDSYQFPSGRYRRGMSDIQIHQLAQKGSGSRGVSRKKIKEMSKWLKLQEEIDELYEKSKKLEDEAIDEIIDSSEVVCTTNSTAGSELMEGRSFDVTVIDEATQATEPSCLIPMNRSDRVVFAGDHKQLPPTVLAKEAKEDLQVTAFEKLVSREGDGIREMLLTQFRMHEDIMEFSNEEFYGGRLKADASVVRHTLNDLGVDAGPRDSVDEKLSQALNPEEPVVFLDTGETEGKERQRPGSNSRENETEARLVSLLVTPLLDKLDPREIGIISPYDDQVDLLNSQIGKENLEIKTVDGFQGREKEVIIISFVRSNPENQLGFLTDVRRLNVSLTRARRKLIMVGDSGTLASHRTYNNLMEYVRTQGTFLAVPSGLV